MKRKIPIIIGAIMIILVLIKSLNNNKFFSRAICYEKEKMYNLKLNTLVIRKYNDKEHHNYNTLLLKELDSGHEIKLYIVLENGRYYHKVLVGDTLKKESGSLIIWNLTQNKIDTLRYNCDN